MEVLTQILYALPVYQSVILSVLLFWSSNKKLSLSRLLMGIFQLLMAFYFSFNLFYSLRSFEIVGAIYFLILPVILLFIPVFYLYMLSITNPGLKFSRIHLVHFAPAALVTLLNTPYLYATHTEKLDFITYGYNMVSGGNLFSYLLVVYMFGILVLFSLQLIWYSVKSVKLYRKHKVYIANRYSYTENINLDWIRVLIVCFLVFFIFNDILFLIGFRQHFITQVFYNSAMLITTLYVGYRGLLQVELNEEPSINSSAPAFGEVSFMDENNKERSLQNAISESNTSNYSDISSSSKTSKKYSGSALNEHQKKVLLEKIQLLMEKDKIFINDKLSLEDVAVKLDTNTKYISQIINEIHNKNFYNYINSFRVDEAKRLLASQENDKYSILGIAQSVGFVSKSTFNVAFKRYTGHTPTEYKKIVEKSRELTQIAS